jgi:SET domain-containing protein
MLIYPYDLDLDAGYPSRSSFVVKKQDSDMGYGVYSKKRIERGSMVARFTGRIVHTVVQHSLQINPTTHILDTHFAGFLLHSCNPNVILDMSDFTIWALRDIDENEALTMDYASTEDILFKQFQCLCNSENCRHWITGRKERVNEEGMAYLNGIAMEKEAVRIRMTA